jgi:moderate conductance mechanosensitive channel
MRSAHYTTAGIILLAFALAAVLVRLADIVIHRLLGRLDIVGTEDQAAIHQGARRLVRALMLMAYGVAAAASISFALSRLGIAEPRWNLADFGRWFTRHGVNIIIIVVGATVVIRGAHLVIEHLQFKIGRRQSHSDLEWQRRATTVTGILTSLVSVSVGFVAILMLLRELSIDVLPVLTTAGIAGLAVGFGAQNFVRDVISGFFLILEDQVRVGDLVRINNSAGIVEQINLRTIVLRDDEGAVHVFPNGTITALANLSKHYAYAIIELRVAYGENIDRVIAVVREVGTSLEGDPDWRPFLLGPLEAAGVDSLANGAALLRVRFKTLPLNQGKVANEARQRLLAALVARGIRPYAG